jgi:hypothetical protein
MNGKQEIAAYRAAAITAGLSGTYTPEAKKVTEPMRLELNRWQVQSVINTIKCACGEAK